MENLARKQCSRHNRSHHLTSAILSLGSNLTEGHARVRQCLAALAGLYHLTALTPSFVTDDIHAAAFRPPLEMPRRYVNALAVIVLPSPPLVEAANYVFDLRLKALETKLGRTKAEKARGLVTIDIDAVVISGAIARPADFLRPYFHPRALML